MKPLGDSPLSVDILVLTRLKIENLKQDDEKISKMVISPHKSTTIYRYKITTKCPEERMTIECIGI